MIKSKEPGTFETGVEEFETDYEAQTDWRAYERTLITDPPEWVIETIGKEAQAYKEHFSNVSPLALDAQEHKKQTLEQFVNKDSVATEFEFSGYYQIGDSGEYIEYIPDIGSQIEKDLLMEREIIRKDSQGEPQQFYAGIKKRTFKNSELNKKKPGKLLRSKMSAEYLAEIGF